MSTFLSHMFKKHALIKNVVRVIIEKTDKYISCILPALL